MPTDTPPPVRAEETAWGSSGKTRLLAKFYRLLARMDEHHRRLLSTQLGKWLGNDSDLGTRVPANDVQLPGAYKLYF